MAQDFRAAFGLGSDDKTITQVDVNGVALAAIQGLHRLAQQQARAIAELREQLDSVEAVRQELASLRAALARLQREQAVAVR
jgi:hypothetical protein